MNNITFNSPSFGAKVDLQKTPENINRILKVIESDVKEVGEEKALKVMDTFEKIHPEDVIEITPKYEMSEIPYIDANAKSWGFSGNQLSNVLEAYEKERTFTFKNLRTEKSYTTFVRNFVDTVDNINKKFTELFEK